MKIRWPSLPELIQRAIILLKSQPVRTLAECYRSLWQGLCLVLLIVICAEVSGAVIQATEPRQFIILDHIRFLANGRLSGRFFMKKELLSKISGNLIIISTLLILRHLLQIEVNLILIVIISV